MTVRWSLGIGLTLITAACGSASPPAQANDSAAAARAGATAPAASRPDKAETAPIPTAYHGEWAAAATGCARTSLADADGRAAEPVRAPGGLVIGAAEIRFDEGIARIDEARAVPGGIALRGTFTYVDEAPYAATLRLTGDRLVVAGEWGEDAFVRCGPDESDDRRP